MKKITKIILLFILTIQVVSIANAEYAVEETNRIIPINSKELKSKPTLLYSHDIKGSLDDNFISPPLAGKSEYGKVFHYRIKARRNDGSTINKLFVLHVIPDGVKLSDTIDSQNGVKIYYTKDNDYDYSNLQDFYKNGTWKDSVDDYSEVKAIKLEVENGNELESPQFFEAILSYRIDANYEELEMTQHNLYLATSSILNFSQSSTIENHLIRYSVSGNIYEDINNNGFYESGVDKGFSKQVVELVDALGQPIKDLEGKSNLIETDSNGFYRFDIFKAGKYAIRVHAPAGYQLIEPNYNNEFGSHINSDGQSDLFFLNINQRNIRINGGYIKEKRQLYLSNEALDESGKAILEPIDFMFEIKIDGNLYSGLAKKLDLKTGEFIDIKIEDGLVVFSQFEKIVIENLNEMSNYQVTIHKNNLFNRLHASFVGSLSNETTQLNFINQKKDSPINITIEKNWYGGRNRPTSVIGLFRNGQLIDEVKLSKANLWRHNWEELSRVDSSGNLYEYDVKELTELKNYTTKKTRKNNHFTLVSRFVSPKLSIPVVVDWRGGSNHPEIEVILFRNGERITSKTTRNHLVSFDNLDTHDFNGNKYSYSIDVSKVPFNYQKHINGFNIQNIYNGKTITYGTSFIWSKNLKSKEDLIIQLYQNGQKYGEPIKIPYGKLDYRFYNLPMVDSSGNFYKYEIKSLGGQDLVSFGNVMKVADLGEGDSTLPSAGAEKRWIGEFITLIGVCLLLHTKNKDSQI